MQKLMQYLKDVRSELLKVSWPSWSELSSATVLVIVLSLIMSLFVFGCDEIISKILQIVMRSGW
jgi:preprotein translocase subunit SecE